MVIYQYCTCGNLVVAIAATGANYGSCGGHYINRWPHGEMAMCVASSIVADQETLDQIRLENSEFYGDQLSEEEDHHYRL